MPSRAAGKSAQKQMRRFSVSLPREQYDQVLAIARKNRVSTAWVIREAVERLLCADMPLFHLRRPQ
jgi:metal-responsive CopG/Arc/MetJ family transcriptional regulator